MNQEPNKKRRLNEPVEPMESIDPPTDAPDAKLDSAIATCGMATLGFAVTMILLVAAIANLDDESVANVFTLMLVPIPIAIVLCLAAKRPWHELGLFIDASLPFLLGRLCFA